MENKRRFPRILTELSVACQVEKARSVKASGKSFNLSFVGIGVKMENVFKADDEVIITIRKPFWGHSVTIKGRIVWQREVPGQYESLMGIKFTEESSPKLDGIINSI